MPNTNQPTSITNNTVDDNNNVTKNKWPRCNSTRLINYDNLGAESNEDSEYDRNDEIETPLNKLQLVHKDNEQNVMMDYNMKLTKI